MCVFITDGSWFARDHCGGTFAVGSVHAATVDVDQVHIPIALNNSCTVESSSAWTVRPIPSVLHTRKLPPRGSAQGGGGCLPQTTQTWQWQLIPLIESIGPLPATRQAVQAVTWIAPTVPPGYPGSQGILQTPICTQVRCGHIQMIRWQQD